MTAFTKFTQCHCADSSVVLSRSSPAILHLTPSPRRNFSCNVAYSILMVASLISDRFLRFLPLPSLSSERSTAELMRATKGEFLWHLEGRARWLFWKMVRAVSTFPMPWYITGLPGCHGLLSRLNPCPLHRLNPYLDPSFVLPRQTST